MTEIDHVYTPDKIVCPHCGYEIEDSPYTSENDLAGVDDCPKCRRGYQYECVEITHYWTTNAPT